MELPVDIKEIFFETMYGSKTVLDFEQWLYSNKSLEAILTHQDYLDLISYGYKGDRVKYGLYKLLVKHIDLAEYEKWKLVNQLRKALNRDKDLPYLLITFYNLYCKGYHFLDNIGLGYGLVVEVPSNANSWDELSSEQQESLLDSFYPDIEFEIKKVIEWLETGKVVLIGKHDDFSQYEYIDNRTQSEKYPTAYQLNTVKPKSWWKFW
jgi:hypothetical protein